MNTFFEGERVAICTLRDIATGKEILVGRDDEFPLDEDNPETVYDDFTCKLPIDEAGQTTVLADELLKNGFVLRSYEVARTTYHLADYYLESKNGRNYITNIYIDAQVDILKVDMIMDDQVRSKITQPPYILE